ncbi:MAG: hypothetical protein Q4G52_03020 [Clostridia bacterium]|nr:hypothetical protein [Clostridia bacterium]
MTQKMKEMGRLCRFLVDENAGRPQHVVDKPSRRGGGNVDNCILRAKPFAKKALKTGLFFDMIGTLSRESCPQEGQLFNMLWKPVWISTRHPQDKVEKMWKSLARRGYHKINGGIRNGSRGDLGKGQGALARGAGGRVVYDVD